MQSSLRLCGILLAICLLSCHSTQRSISFYYWRTHFRLDSTEREALSQNKVQHLYVRFFDVDKAPGDSLPAPVAPIVFDTAIGWPITPVVFIRNRVFSRDTTGIGMLCQNVYRLVQSIDPKTTGIQFDCDWTQTTRAAYFYFLRQYKTLSAQHISATIRLHQIKYRRESGIPPVDDGLLMYYNMGNIDSSQGNSIFNKDIAAKYIGSLSTYPLTLDLGLPIFAWGLQIREGKVVRLLDKMNFLHFENDTNFIATAPGRYQVKHACFHGGYYFQQHDAVKAENIDGEDLFAIIDQVNAHSNHRIRNLIFYDLDKENLQLFDKTIFRQTLDRVR